MPLRRETIAPEEQPFILTNLSPGPAQKRLALAIVLTLLVCLYLITGPLAGVQLAAVSGFVAVYATAMFVTDSITAVLVSPSKRPNG